MSEKWRRVPLSAVAGILPSNVDKKSNPGEPEVRLCNYLDAYTHEYITNEIEFVEATATPGEILRFHVDCGDIVITKDSETPDDIGIASVVTDQIEGLVCGYHLALLRPDRGQVDPVYLKKQLGSAESAKYFGSRANGSTRYGLTFGALSGTPVNLAPISHQRRIAEILSALDEEILQTEMLISKMQQVKAGLMHDLFTRGVLPNGQLRPPREEAPQLYKESPLGWIPKEWQSLKCADICSVITVGIVLRPTQYYVQQGVPAFRSANVREGGINSADLVYISPESNARLLKSQLREGDVISVRTGYPGTSTAVPSEYEGANCIDLLISRPLSPIRSAYLAAWINSPLGKEQVLRKQGGLAQQHFNVGELRELRIALSDASEQDRVLARLAVSDSRILQETALAAKYRLAKSGLMQDLLTGRVRIPESMLKKAGVTP